MCEFTSFRRPEVRLWPKVKVLFRFNEKVIVSIMIIRIFVALLVLNVTAFVVRADASERMFNEPSEIMTAEDIYELQQRMAGDFDDAADAVAEIGSRLLSLSLVRTDNSGKQYASSPVQADHGVALLNEGASLNLKWNF
ncbi:MAG: hypothetical protein ACI92B_001307 [Marinobacter maritimus]